MRKATRGVLLAAGLSIAHVLAAQNALKPESDFSDEPFVFEEDIIKISFENDGTGVREASARIRIQSDAAVQQYGILTYTYQSAVEKFEVVHVRVRKPDGSVVVTPPESMQDMPAAITRESPFYSDLQEKHVAVKALGVGDILETLAVWRTDRPLVPGQFGFHFSWSPEFVCLRHELTLNVPRDRKLKWTSAAVQPAITEQGSRRIFVWKRSNLTRRSSEEKKEENRETAQQAARGILPAPDIEVSSFTSWESVGDWAADLMKDRVKPGPDIRAKAAELTRDAKDEEAKLRAIYKYVASQIRYVGISFGIGRYQPHPASEVLSNQYGDCKDKHVLMASLLEAVGIRAFPGLMSSGRVLDEAVPLPAQFDHVVTVVPRGDGYLFLDSTAEVAPFGYLLQRLQDKPALVVRGDGTSTFRLTPYPPAPGRQTFRMKATLSDTGMLEGSAEAAVQGDDTEILLRGAFRATSMAQWKDLVQVLSSRSGFGGTVSEVTASSPLDTVEPMRWSYKYSRENYSDWSNRRIRPPLPPMRLPDPGEKPSGDVWLGNPFDFHFESTVTLPQGSQPRLPSNRKLDEPFAEYLASYSFRDGVLFADRKLVIKQREVPRAQLESYRKFAKTLEQDQDSLTDLDPPPRVTPYSYRDAIWDLPYSENSEAVRAYEDARSASRQGKYTETIAALRRAVDADPEFTRAWLWLGDEYRFEKKEKASLEAFRSAIRNDPSERLSYRILAFSLTMLGRLDEAIATWKQLVAVAPDDSEAWAYMGITLAQEKRYVEAVEALESAVNLDPDRDDLYVPLGAARASAGQEAKAVEAFQRGFAGNTTSDALNMAAYSLADADLRLPLALEYAEKAVAMEEAATAKLTLAELKTNDLVTPVRLAANWDTLGWVYFRMGRLDRAEQYVEASWALEQSPIVADHLGQIYQQGGETERALDMYALALAAMPAGQESKETLARLRRLSGKTASAGDDVVHRERLMQLRTVKLPKLTNADASAEFLVLIGPGSKVLETKFVSGDSRLKSAGKALWAASPTMNLPDDQPTRVIRRGVLSCAAASDCSLVFYPVGRVRSLE
jgi:tetratricopeptide (TPR) repeat protein